MEPFSEKVLISVDITLISTFMSARLITRDTKAPCHIAEREKVANLCVEAERGGIRVGGLGGSRQGDQRARQ